MRSTLPARLSPLNTGLSAGSISNSTAKHSFVDFGCAFYSNTFFPTGAVFLPSWTISFFGASGRTNKQKPLMLLGVRSVFQRHGVQHCGVPLIPVHGPKSSLCVGRIHLIKAVGLLPFFDGCPLVCLASTLDTRVRS